jgi:hypothetical protein
MNKDKLLEAASFSPRSLEPSAWLGHLPFAGWVIQEVSPNIFVELGTYFGSSYFSFCQSVAEAGLATECYAVDTWKGDAHAGQYGNEVYERVLAHQLEHYAGFSRLLRLAFDEAATHFPDGSIGLLHIDGLHTYEAVRHDFETWLPKLTPGAIVMFHDTNVREKDFGVWKLWEELQVRYPNNLEFLHSHGLGVLQLNNSPNVKILEWLKPNSPDKQRLIDYFGSLGSMQLARFTMNTLKQSLDERDRQIAALHAEIMRIKSTNSWRITKPLRLLDSSWRKLFTARKC